jgi:hypothetical protein
MFVDVLTGVRAAALSLMPFHNLLVADHEKTKRMTKLCEALKEEVIVDN